MKNDKTKKIYDKNAKKQMQICKWGFDNIIL